MRKICIALLSAVLIFGGVGSAAAALTFDLDFGQDGTYEDYWELRPSEYIFIDLYASGIPGGVPQGLGSRGLGVMQIDIVYDPLAVEITPGTDIKISDMGHSPVDLLTPGHIVMKANGMAQLFAGVDSAYGDDVLIGTIEFHCKGPFGITELWLFDTDRGFGQGFFDDWVLFDGTVLDDQIMNGVKLGEINQTPIPGALVLLGSGLLGLVAARTRKRK